MNLIRATASRLLTVASLLPFLMLGGCGEVVSSGKNLQVTNEVNVFRFQVSDLKNYSQTYSFTWTTSSTTGVIVNQLSDISGGDATIVLKDAAGTTVYSRSMKQDGRFASAVGVPGLWTVQILANKVSGSLLMRADPN